MPTSVSFKIRPDNEMAVVLRPTIRGRLGPKTERIASKARALAPVGGARGWASESPGRMARSITTTYRDGRGRYAPKRAKGVPVCSYEIAVKVPYARFVLRGTSSPIYSTSGRPMYNSRTSEFFGMTVSGQKANDFLSKALLSERL